MDKNQKVELYKQLSDLFDKLRNTQCTVELLAHLLSSEGGDPCDKAIRENFSSALYLANDNLYSVWDKMTDLEIPLRKALTEE